MRCKNLNELIYKQGQSGVTRASVTLVFDNQERSLSPHGYEQYSQITVTRQVSTRDNVHLTREDHASACTNLLARGESCSMLCLSTRALPCGEREVLCVEWALGAR